MFQNLLSQIQQSFQTNLQQKGKLGYITSPIRENGRNDHGNPQIVGIIIATVPPGIFQQIKPKTHM